MDDGVEGIGRAMTLWERASASREEMGMRELMRWRRSAAILAVAALIAAACGNGEEAAVPEPDPAPPSSEAPAAEEEAGPDVVFDVGVTEDPCPNAVNPDNGCIYLGILSDLSEGPFAPLAVPITDGQVAFWRTINEAGGIGGFDIDVSTYTRDTLYQEAEHSARYREIEPNILALAQTLGTPTTEAILSDMDDDDVIAAPASWWSGWDFDIADRGLILNSGYSYCIESMIGLDWYVAENGPIDTVIHVGYPGDYGGDSAAGVEHWAQANDVTFAGRVETAPNIIVGSQDGAVGAVLGSGADVVFLAVGPAETAQIVGGAAAQGFTGRFVGSVPTWNPALLQTPASGALEALYTNVSPWEPFDGESAAHDAIRASLGGELPDNDGYVFGWIWSYPFKAAIEAAVANGDLTRAGLRSVVDGLVVDYEGSLPTRTFGGDANVSAVRTAVINVPDASTSLGLRTLATGVTGPTADNYDYSAPCIM
ncbi:MAG: ABC transporter substrate-binding protein [Nitriliruptoraceae bacterium]